MRCGAVWCGAAATLKFSMTKFVSHPRDTPSVSSSIRVKLRRYWSFRHRVAEQGEGKRGVRRERGKKGGLAAWLPACLVALLQCCSAAVLQYYGDVVRSCAVVMVWCGKI